MTASLGLDLLLLGLLAGAVALAARLRPPAPPREVPPALRGEGEEDEPPTRSRSRFELLALQAGLSPRARWPFRIVQGLLALVFALLAVSLAPLTLPVAVLVVVGALVGAALAELWIRGRRRKRRRRIEAALSFLLDLVVALLAAGLTLPEALRRAGAHGLSPGHPLGEEIWRLGRELDAGRAPAEALRDFADRTGSPAVRAVAAALIVSLRHGTSVESALATQAELARTKERERARRALMTAATKAVFPLFLCGFPVFLVIALFPAVLEVVESLRGIGRLF